jgi:hypothetical protein
MGLRVVLHLNVRSMLDASCGIGDVRMCFMSQMLRQQLCVCGPGDRLVSVWSCDSCFCMAEYSGPLLWLVSGLMQLQRKLQLVHGFPPQCGPHVVCLETSG